MSGPAGELPHDLDRMAASDAYNDWLFSRARPFVHGRVLDAGAGIGTFTGRLKATSQAVVALEPDEELAGLLRQRHPDVEVVVGDANAVEGPFDAILCFNVLEHIRDDEAVLRRFRELLAPSGRLLLLVPAHPFLYGSIDRTFGHERRYSSAALTQSLRRAGMHPVLTRHVNPVGAVGWFVSARVVRRKHLPAGQLRVFDRLVPILRPADRVPLPLGLSLWCVARPGAAATPTGTA